MPFEHYILRMNGPYDAPEVSDYGSLVDLTSAVHLLLGHSAGADLSFSSPGVAGAGNTSFEAGRLGATGGAHHAVAPGGAGSGGLAPDGGAGALHSGGSGGSAGGASGAGAAGELPFTGFAAAGAAAIGTGLAAAGSAIRR